MKIELKIHAIGYMSEFAHFRVFNGHQELVGKGYERLELSLEKGIYIVEMELNQTTKSEYVRLTADTTKVMEIDTAYSSIPVTGYSSSFEYYTKNASVWSREITVSQSDILDPRGSLFMFFRYPDEQLRESLNSESSLGKDFKLLNAKRILLYELQGENIKEDLHHGWMAFHVELPVGQYFLLYEGENPREMPVYVYKNWQTQIFLTFREEPIFSSLRIAIEKKHIGFNPDNDNYNTLEALIQKLVNGIYFLPSELQRAIASNKWESPMNAILGVYSYILGKQNISDKLFETILRNLEERILKDNFATEIKALKILFALHRNKDDSNVTVPNINVSNPCILAAGMRALINASYEGVNSIKSNSIAEQIIKLQFSDLIWTSYIPLPYQSKQSRLEGLITRGPGSSGGQIESHEFEEQTGDSRIGFSLMEKLNMEAKFFEKGMLSEDRLSDPVRIAKDLNITQKVLNDVVDKLIAQPNFFKDNENKSLKKIKGFEGNISYNEKAIDLLKKIQNK